jgi:transcriptional regulator GlxA family with amidase domain
VVTGNGPAAAAAFALTIVAQSIGRDRAAQVASDMLLPANIIS